MSIIKELYQRAKHEMNVYQLYLEEIDTDKPLSGYRVIIKGAVCDSCRENAQIIAKEYGVSAIQQTDKVIIG